MKLPLARSICQWELQSGKQHPLSSSATEGRTHPQQAYPGTRMNATGVLLRESHVALWLGTHDDLVKREEREQWKTTCLSCLFGASLL
jgi:hypothetical protein